MTDPSSAPLEVTVVWAASAADVREVKLHLPPGSTLADAVRASRLVPLTATAPLDLGVFNQPRPPDTPVRNGDRVEIYRPLAVDPKEARRIRAEVRRRRGQR